MKTIYILAATAAALLAPMTAAAQPTFPADDQYTALTCSPVAARRG